MGFKLWWSSASDTTEAEEEAVLMGTQINRGISMLLWFMAVSSGSGGL